MIKSSPRPRAKLTIALENVCVPGKPPRPESAAAFALGDERLPAVGVAVAGAVSVSVRIVRVAIAVGVRCIGVEPAETEVAVKSMAKAAVTPTAAQWLPFIAIPGPANPPACGP